jgi:carbamoyl-phosphate synthase large subunit
MRSTGEVMGIDKDFASSYAKAQIAAGQKLPAAGGKVFLSMTDKYKPFIVPVARELAGLGYQLVATRGTAAALAANGVPCEKVFKISEGRPNPADLIKNGELVMMMITSGGDEADLRDGKDLRRLALSMQIPIITTIAGAKATAQALAAMKQGQLKQVPLQDFFPNYKDDSNYLMTGIPEPAGAARR